jgi:hypothetical protein
VWRSYGEALTQEVEVALHLEERLVMPIDALDNGVDLAEAKFPGIRVYSIGDYIYSYLDRSISDPEYLLDRFIKVVDVAKALLEREIQNTRVTLKRK